MCCVVKHSKNQTTNSEPSILADYNQLWNQAQQAIHDSLAARGLEQEYDTWFRPVTFESYDKASNVLLVRVPSRAFSETIEKKYLNELAYAVLPLFPRNVILRYHTMVDTTSVIEGADSELVRQRGAKEQKAPTLPDIDPQLDPQQNFKNFIEGDSNRLSRSVGLKIAEHPKGTTFNPMFVYGPSGCGKTHLINAIGVRTKELYPQKRVLYVSARIFQQQYTTARLNNTINDFIAFYQTIDVLIVDDVQEWMTAEKTQDTFFHIFDYLFRHQKRIILACDRSPAQLRGMHERLITRFACGATCEVEKPNVQLCMDILMSKITRDGLAQQFPDEVVRYIAENVTGSVRDLQGVINSLLAYSIIGNQNIDMKLAEKIVKRIVQVNDTAITLDSITDAVCEVFNVSEQDINGKSRKKTVTTARQVLMFLAQQMTGMPASRIGRLIGGRDHSTVLHSIKKIETVLKKDKEIKSKIDEIKKKLK